MQAALASAEVEIESGKVSDAEGHLDTLHQQVKQEGYVVDEFEARLLLGKAQLKSGNTTMARTSLDKLQSEARAKGFLLVARKAEALRPH